MNLHEDKNLFIQAIQATSQRLKIPEIYVEKDYWVTVALHRIFHGEARHYAIFKGGTALSKCHRLIERFSEDIDMVVIREIEDNGNKLKKKLKIISESVEPVMPEIALDGVTNKLGMIRKTAHEYPKANVKGTFGQVREHIIIESSWLGTSEPHVKSNVTCYITEMMEATGQQMLIEKHALQSFEVQVLSKERTLCEKIMSLVRFSHTDTPYADLSNKIRHVYDLHLMLKNDETLKFFQSTAFDEMLNIVGNDDLTGFKNNNQWLAIHPAKAVIFKNPEDTWKNIRQAYQGTFKDLVTGILPDENDLVKTMAMIGERLEKISWLVMPPAADDKLNDITPPTIK